MDTTTNFEATETRLRKVIRSFDLATIILPHCFQPLCTLMSYNIVLCVHHLLLPVDTPVSCSNLGISLIIYDASFVSFSVPLN